MKDDSQTLDGFTQRSQRGLKYSPVNTHTHTHTRTGTCVISLNGALKPTPKHTQAS